MKRINWSLCSHCVRAIWFKSARSTRQQSAIVRVEEVSGRGVRFLSRAPLQRGLRIQLEIAWGEVGAFVKNARYVAKLRKYLCEAALIDIDWGMEIFPPKANRNPAKTKAVEEKPKTLAAGERGWWET